MREWTNSSAVTGDQRDDPELARSDQHGRQLAQHHEVAVIGSADADRLLDAAVASLAATGFTIRQRTDHALIATSPSLMNTRQPPLHGAGRIVLTATNKSLTVHADLSSLQGMITLLRWLPLIILAMDALIFGILAAAGAMPWWTLTLIAIPTLALLAVGPLIAGSMTRRTRRAIDQWAHSLAAGIP